MAGYYLNSAAQRLCAVADLEVAQGIAKPEELERLRECSPSKRPEAGLMETAHWVMLMGALETAIEIAERQRRALRSRAN